jgi:predicted ThiF/HesA family dinucleotide-utilizing enzyme
MLIKSKYLYDSVNKVDIKNHLFLELLTNNPFSTRKYIKNATFLILGCGGIGNFLSFAINSFSPTKIILVDGDKIEKSNLNRQFLFSESDIGKYKTDIVRNKLSSYGYGTKIVSVNHFVNKKIIYKLLEKNQKNIFAIISADSIGLLVNIVPILTKNCIPFINVGYLNDISTIGPMYIDKDTACPLCNDYIQNDNNFFKSKINNNYSSPSSFVNNALSSSLAMRDILSFFTYTKQNIMSINKRIGITNTDFQKTEVPIKKNQNCKYCNYK